MRLGEWLERENWLASDFADQVEARPSDISRYKQGYAFPRRIMMERIVKITGGQVTANDFLSDASLRIIRRAQRDNAGGRF